LADATGSDCLALASCALSSGTVGDMHQWNRICIYTSYATQPVRRTDVWLPWLATTMGSEAALRRCAGVAI
ncbi:hypothetical protein KCU76_g109, partial [Aureobasidium melanogenum]